MVTVHFRSELFMLCRQAFARVLMLSRGKVCVSRTHAFIFSNCTHGQADSVLDTFEVYASTHPSFSIGPDRGEFVEEVVKRLAPLRVLELGMHCGYVSVRILRQLPSTGKLLTVEVDPHTADKGEEIILVAGFKHTQFKVLTSSSEEAISALRSHLGEKNLDLVLMDHDPKEYLPSLLALQREELLSPGCVLLINNALDTGAKALLEYIRTSQACLTVGRQVQGMMELQWGKVAYPEGTEC
ncbi:transmembrane O-methyltransferase homolog [Chanos chanos]|uniref:catechol O-methyltransferase n=1 Tax=Chanos chanos TaxID=29144 RepID=A0A6J2W4Q3_CHACN|nr:transmembrane O-methyltransferase homolog [Chanos chanos]